MTRADLLTLNRKLAADLGLVLGLSKGKYEWRDTVDCSYYFNKRKICWAERLGRGYVLCVWSLPETFVPNTCTFCNGSGQLHREQCASCGGRGCFPGGTVKKITEGMWKEMFGGSIPYPKNGEYKALAETFCLHVTPEMNQNYIWAIDRQVQQSYADQMERIMIEKKLEREEWKQKFEDATFDAMPSFMTSESWMQG